MMGALSRLAAACRAEVGRPDWRLFAAFALSIAAAPAALSGNPAIPPELRPKSATPEPFVPQLEAPFSDKISEENIPVNSPADKASEKGGEKLAVDVWTQASVTGPAARVAPSMTYDSTRQRTVLFGGSTLGFNATNNSQHFNDTWLWDGSTWQSVTPATSPSVRFGAAIAHDSARGRTVLFGGRDLNTYRNETWEWNGTTWAQVSTSGPSGRYCPSAMAYDSARQRVVLFGGIDVSAPLSDTWEWDGSTWTNRSIAGPSPRYLQSMTYDPARQRVVLFGGVGLSGTSTPNVWEYDGTAWTERVAVGPSARLGVFMAFDAGRGRTVLFGGSDGSTVLNDTWEWNGSSWSSVSATVAPSTRLAGGVSYHAASQRLTLYGGNFTNSVNRGDTWTYFNDGAAPSGPANDNFADAVVLTGNGGAVSGTTVNATREGSEPTHGFSMPSVWFRWTASASGSFNLNTCTGTTYDSVISVYTGSSVGSLALVSQNDQFCGNQSSLTFNATAGTTYQIAVAGSTSNSTGAFTLGYSLNGAGTAAEVDVLDDFSQSIASGASTGLNFGSVVQNQTSPSRTFRVRNLGATTLTTSNLNIPAPYTVIDSLAASIAPGQEDSVTLRLPSSTVGTFARTVSFNTNDINEGTYSFGVTGTVVAGLTNDNFASPAVLAGTSGTAQGTTSGGSRETGEPTHWGSSTSPSVWYTWTAPASGVMSMNTCVGTGYDSVIAVYTGSALNALTLVTNNDDSCGLQTRVSFNAVVGTVYRIAVTGYASGSAGAFSLSYSLDGAISGPEVEVLEPVYSSVINSGSTQAVVFGLLTRNSPNPSRTVRVRNIGTSTLLTSRLSVGFPYSITEGLSSSLAPGAEDSFIITLSTVNQGTFNSTVTFGTNDVTENPFTFGITGTVVEPPVNDDFADAIVLSGNSGTVNGTNVYATRETSEPFHAGFNTSRSIWYRWTPSYSGQVAIDTIGSAYDTTLAVYTGAGLGSLTSVVGNDDAPGLGLRSRVYFVTAGQTYHIAVDGYNSQQGSVVLNYGPSAATPDPTPIPIPVPACAVTLISPTPGATIAPNQVYTFAFSGTCGSVAIIFTGGQSTTGVPFVSFPVSGGSFTLTGTQLDQIRGTLGGSWGCYWTLGTVSGSTISTVFADPQGTFLPAGTGPGSSVVTVPGTACIQFAGQSTGSLSVVNAGACADVVANHLPPALELSNLGAVQILATGFTKTSALTPGNVGPAGELVAPVATESAYGIYGVSTTTNRYGALLGLWDNQSIPFYIGTGGTFAVPTGATRLYLGVHDSACWTDNTGNYSITITGAAPSLNLQLGAENWQYYH